MSETEDSKVTEVEAPGKDSAEAGSAYIGAPPSYDHTSKEDFKFYQVRLSTFFDANDITSDVKKKAILLASLADKTYKILNQLCAPESPDNLEFSVLLKHLEDSFADKEGNEAFKARLAFFIARKEKTESYKEWAERLEKMAGECQFESDPSLLIKDIFVVGLMNGFVRTRLLKEDPTSNDLTVESLIDLANKAEHLKDVNIEDKKCGVCGMRNHLAETCKFKGKACHTCGGKGHVTPACPETLKMKARKRQAMRKFNQASAPKFMRNNRGGGNPRMNSLFTSGGNYSNNYY